MIVAKLWRRLKYWKFFVRSFAVHGVVALHRFGLLSEDRVVSARMWAVRAACQAIAGQEDLAKALRKEWRSAARKFKRALFRQEMAAKLDMFLARTGLMKVTGASIPFGIWLRAYDRAQEAASELENVRLKIAKQRVELIKEFSLKWREWHGGGSEQVH